MIYVINVTTNLLIWLGTIFKKKKLKNHPKVKGVEHFKKGIFGHIQPP